MLAKDEKLPKNRRALFVQRKKEEARKASGDLIIPDESPVISQVLNPVVIKGLLPPPAPITEELTVIPGFTIEEGDDIESTMNKYLEKSLYCKGTSIDLTNKSVVEIMDIRNQFSGHRKHAWYKQQSSLRLRLTELGDAVGHPIMPHQISDVFWNMWIDYLIDKGYKLSTVTTMSLQLRAVIDWASKHNAEVNPTFVDLKTPQYYTKSVALTPDDVSWIYHFDINACQDLASQTKRVLCRVRDAFCLSCNLGQRYSDMIRINKDCFDRNKFTIVQQKTGNKSFVDMDKFAIDSAMVYEILERYDYKFPYTYDLSNYNKNLKILFKLIGFNDMIKIESKVQGSIKTVYKPKWDMMSSHTARRTFATVNVLRGRSIFDIRRATGHKTEEAFNHYICVDDL